MTSDKPGQMRTVYKILFGNSEKNRPPRSVTVRSRIILKSLKYYILIIVQLDATQSSLFIIVQVHSTCFDCQQHPSSGVHKTVTTAAGTVVVTPKHVE